MSLVNSVVGLFMKNRLNQVDAFRKNPFDTQQNLFDKLIGQARNTDFGKKYGFNQIRNYEDFRNNVPIFTYEQFTEYIDKAREGVPNVSWSGRIKWFAKSSGTTNAKSKFIPISDESLNECHYTAGKMMFSLYLNNYPETRIFHNKNLRIGGSSDLYQDYNTLFGDLSAILIDNLPFYAELKNTPNRKISLMSEWESKLEAITHAVVDQNIGSLTGVPSWMLVLLNNILEYTEKSNIHELWPELEVFFHGGINFSPYKENYDKIGNKPLNYFEIYNASEGFFALQDQRDSKDLLLLLDNGIFFEFIPFEEFGNENARALPIWEIEKGKNYALVISTNGGLWRYIIGDTVRIMETSPFRIRVSGRTKHYINAFGEELIIDNAETALNKACQETGAQLSEYSAGPIFMQGNSSGAHEWIIEFEKKPNRLEVFSEVLDEALKNLNSDYEAKRYNNMTLSAPKIHIARPNLFYDWMKKRGKLGGQNKVPRLANNREFLDELLELNHTE